MITSKILDILAYGVLLSGALALLIFQPLVFLITVLIALFVIAFVRISLKLENWFFGTETKT